MDRRLIAYLLIALLAAALALLIVRVRYRSRDNMLKRRRQADEMRRKARRIDANSGD